MTVPGLNHATYQFKVVSLVPSAVQQHAATVTAHLDQFVQVYDTGQAKSRQWIDIDYSAVHQWVESNASTPLEFRDYWGLAASAVFFRYDNGGSTIEIPDPCPGCWEGTSLRAYPRNEPGSTSYEWVYNSNTNQWVRVCSDIQSLVPTEPSAPVHPEVVVDGQVIAVVRGNLLYGQEVVAV